MAEPDVGRGLCSQEIALPDPLPWPAVACTPVELERLRAAWQGTGDVHEVVAARIRAAEKALVREVEFPPEGGQHNQWYQCDRCQIALKRVDDTHHRCPSCDTIYTGYPYDQVVYSRQHNALTRDLEACAWAWALTGEEGFAQRARDILVGYGERYASYPYHSASMGKRDDEPSRSGGHVFEQTLNEAAWMEAVCSAYDLVRRAPAVSQEDHATLRDGLLLPVYENMLKHRAGKSNWQTFHNSAFLYIGGVLGRPELVHRALCDPENGFYYQMRVSVLPGGMWYENSWSYHFYTLSAIERIVETARRLGLDLYETPEVRQMYTVAFDYRMADGSLPRFGDAVSGGIPGHRYESAYHQWKDPLFLAALPQGPTWSSVLYGREASSEAPAPEPASALREGAGHGILRVAGPDGPSSAVLTFGPFGGFHGHFDKLSFVYFALGRELGYDPGRARSQAYRLPVHGNWYRATTSHNTVLVDGASQEGTAGALEVFLANDRVAAVGARTDEAYPDLLHRRLLVLRPGYLVVADVLEAGDGREHTFDWLYHNLGEAVASPCATAAGQAPEGQGFEFIQDVRTGSCAGPARATFAVGADRVEVTVDAGGPAEVLVGTGVGESVLDRVPLVHVTTRGPGARFAAAIEPIPAGAEPQVRGVRLDEVEGGGWAVCVDLVDGAREICAWDPEGRLRQVEGVEVEVPLACLRVADGQTEVLAP